MGVPVLAAGQAPFIPFETVFFEAECESYRRRLEAFLSAGRLEVPAERQRNTRRFMYYRTYRFSLPFGEFIESTPQTGYVRLKKFSWRDLSPDKSPTLRAFLDGLLTGKPFELDV